MSQNITELNLAPISNEKLVDFINLQLPIENNQLKQHIINENISKIGENISVRRFTRYQLGEGMEKKANDFAAEVAAAAGK